MESLWPLANFAFVSSITPGPNNVMLSASGLAFGLRRTLPHLAGVVFGFAVLLALCGAGVGQLVVAFPALELALKSAGSGYLMYLAWSLRNGFMPDARPASARPLKFHEAALFQVVNPKAWFMGLTAASVFTPEIEPRALALALLCGVFLLVGVPCICAWATLGATLKRWLTSARGRRLFGLALGVLMIYAVAAMWV